MIHLKCVKTFDPCFGFSVIKTSEQVLATKYPLDMYYKLWTNEKQNIFLGTISEYELGLHFQTTNKKAG